MKYNTDGKQQVLRFFRENADKAFSCEEAFCALRHTGIGKSSVYRIISDFEMQSKLKKVHNSTGKQSLFRYASEGSCSEHLHLKCLSCGRLIHLDRVTTGTVEDSLLSSSGFALDEGTPLYGKCQSCIISTERTNLGK